MKTLLVLSVLIGFLNDLQFAYCQNRTGFRFKGLIASKNDQIFVRSNINIGDTITGYLLYKYDMPVTDSIPNTKFYGDTLSPPNLYLKVKTLEITGHPIQIVQWCAVVNGTSVTASPRDKFLINHRGVIYSDVSRYPVTSEGDFRFAFEDYSGNLWDNCNIPKLLWQYSFNKMTLLFDGNGLTSTGKEGSFAYNVSLFEVTPYNLITTSTSPTPKQSLSLSPNPSNTGLFHIEGGSNASSLKVYNLHGKAITPLFPDERTLDLSSFPKGMYFVYSSLDGVIYTQKLLIE